MKNSIPFTVYLQALGGKFLGPHAYEAGNIKIFLSIPNQAPQPIPYPAKPTDDGTISPVFTAASSSFMPILTMLTGTNANPSVSYLTPEAATVAGQGPVEVPQNPVFATLSAVIPTPQGGPVTLEQYVMLSPDIKAYRVTMVVPGLLLTDPVVGNNQIAICATMMCGCKVTEGLTTSYWTPSDFIVTATVHYNDNTSAAYTLSLDLKTNNSTFIAAVPNTASIKHISFLARQISTGNYGTYFY